MEGLPLRLVDGHGESRPDRKLAPTDLDEDGLVVGVSVHDDTGNKAHGVAAAQEGQNTKVVKSDPGSDEQCCA